MRVNEFDLFDCADGLFGFPSWVFTSVYSLIWKSAAAPYGNPAAKCPKLIRRMVSIFMCTSFSHVVHQQALLYLPPALKTAWNMPNRSGISADQAKNMIKEVVFLFFTCRTIGNIDGVLQSSSTSLERSIMLSLVHQKDKIKHLTRPRIRKALRSLGVVIQQEKVSVKLQKIEKLIAHASLDFVFIQSKERPLAFDNRGNTHLQSNNW